MSEKLIFDYDVRARYSNESGELRFINQKSKKSGEGIRKANAKLAEFSFKTWLLELQKNMIQKYYLEGLYDRVITNRRLDYLESNGAIGITRDEALEWYKFIFTFLEPDQIKKRFPTFDNFTEKELGVKK